VKPVVELEAEMSPLAERRKNFVFDGIWLGHGIQPLDVSIASGGILTGTAFINRMEAPALDGLMAAHYLDDPSDGPDAPPDSTVAFRRHMAGLLVRGIFQISEIESRCTGLYDKPLNAMVGTGQAPRKSEMAEDHEVEFIRLMKMVFPYNTVLMNVCCLDQRPPTVVRSGLVTPCHWQVALCRGLDMVAEDKFAGTRDRRPRHLGIRSAIPA
jgi:hypothetical protein